MKISGGRNYVKFDLENGDIVKAEGEILLGRKFVVYKATMKYLAGFHKGEKLSSEQIQDIIFEVQRMTNENTVQLVFE